MPQLLHSDVVHPAIVAAARFVVEIFFLKLATLIWRELCKVLGQVELNLVAYSRRICIIRYSVHFPVVVLRAIVIVTVKGVRKHNARIPLDAVDSDSCRRSGRDHFWHFFLG